MDLHFDACTFYESLPSRRFRARFIYALKGLLPNPGSVFWPLPVTGNKWESSAGFEESHIQYLLCLDPAALSALDVALFQTQVSRDLFILSTWTYSSISPASSSPPPGEYSVQDTWSRLNCFLLSPMIDNSMTQHIFSAFICCQVCIMLKKPPSTPYPREGIGNTCTVSVFRMRFLSVPAAGRVKQHCTILYFPLPTFHLYILQLCSASASKKLFDIYSNWILWLYALPCHYKLDSLSVPGQCSCCWK